MKNCDDWRPSKYVRKNGRLMASRDTNEVGIPSRLIADRIAELYDANLKLHARGRLLDLGCGKVPLYQAYREFVTDVVCVDWENTSHKNNHLDIEADLTNALPFADGEFNTIILSDVLEHIPEPEPFCREMARVLSPQGKLIMNLPFFYCLHEQPYDFYRYTQFALRRFIERSGMRLLQIQETGGSPEVLADVFAKNVALLPVIGSPVAMFTQWAASTFTHTSFGRRISAATGRVFPLGYFLIAEKV